MRATRLGPYLNPTLSSCRARRKVGQLDVWLHKLVREDEVLVHQGGEGSACASHLDVDGGRLCYIRLHRRCCRLQHQKHAKTGEHPRSIGRFPPHRAWCYLCDILSVYLLKRSSVHLLMRRNVGAAIYLLVWCGVGAADVGVSLLALLRLLLSYPSVELPSVREPQLLFLSRCTFPSPFHRSCKKMYNLIGECGQW
jgi:hypothetical protein